MAERKIEERKHLFGTTEKSDFILNMTPQGTHKLCGLYSIIAIAVLLAVNIPYYIASHEFNYAEDGIRHYSDDLFADYIGILVIGVGLIGFWFFLVGRMKKEIVLKDNRALLIPVFIIAVSAWSMFASGAISTAFLEPSQTTLPLPVSSAILIASPILIGLPISLSLSVCSTQ